MTLFEGKSDVINKETRYYQKERCNILYLAHEQHMPTDSHLWLVHLSLHVRLVYLPLPPPRLLSPLSLVTPVWFCPSARLPHRIHLHICQHPPPPPPTPPTRLPKTLLLSSPPPPPPTPLLFHLHHELLNRCLLHKLLLHHGFCHHNHELLHSWGLGLLCCFQLVPWVPE